MTNLKLISITFLGIFTLIGCGGGNTSRGTGWDINSKKGGFQYNIEFNDQETGPGLVFIEGGTITKVQEQDDVLHDIKKTTTIFYPKNLLELNPKEVESFITCEPIANLRFNCFSTRLITSWSS